MSDRYALVDDVENGFEKAAEQIDTVKGDFTVFKDRLERLTRQLKTIGQSVRSQSEGGYNGVFGNEYEAAEFGKFFFNLVKNKDMSSTANDDGGALVPEMLRPRIIDLMASYGKFRRNTTRVKLGTDNLHVPKLTSDLTVYCPSQGGEITKSDLQFGMVRMQVRKFAAMAVLSTELDEDSAIGLGEIIAISLARSMAKQEDLIAFLGDGGSTYFGMKGIVQTLLDVDADPANIAGLQVASGNAYSEITLDDFENLVARLPDDVDESASWFVSKKFFFSVMHRLARAAGAADMFNILSSQTKRYFLGYPVEFVSHMPSTEANSQVCALLGDLSMGTYLGERRELRIERSDEVLFTTDQIAIKGTERIDIVTYGVGDTTNPGPICGLITAAS